MKIEARYDDDNDDDGEWRMTKEASDLLLLAQLREVRGRSREKVQGSVTSSRRVRYGGELSK